MKRIAKSTVEPEAWTLEARQNISEDAEAVAAQVKAGAARIKKRRPASSKVKHKTWHDGLDDRIIAVVEKMPNLSRPAQQVQVVSPTECIVWNVGAPHPA